MSKKQKGPQLKHVRMAAAKRKERNEWLYKLLFAVVVGVAFWAIISFTPVNDHSTVMSVAIFAATFLVVLGVGLVGMKYSRLSTEYNRIKNEYGITEEAVKELIKRES